MKTFFANCLTFFIALTAVINGYASEINNPIPSNLAANACIYISEGTETNITSPVLEEIDPAFYISGETEVFINRNMDTNARKAHIKRETVLKKPSKTAVQTRISSSKIKFKTLLATSKNKEKATLQFGFFCAASAPTVIKSNKIGIVFQNKTAVVLAFKKRQETENPAWNPTIIISQAPAAYALFSRPPTNLG